MTKNERLTNLLAKHEQLTHYIDATDDITPAIVDQLNQTESEISLLINN